MSILSSKERTVHQTTETMARDLFSTTLDSIIGDLRSMRIIPCCGIHERKEHIGAPACESRIQGNNIACLHPEIRFEGGSTFDSPVRRMNNYMIVLSQVFAKTQSPRLQELLSISGNPTEGWQALNAMPLSPKMSETTRLLRVLDQEANAVHRRQPLPMAEACDRIRDHQVSLGEVMLKFRDKLLAIFLEIAKM